MVPQSSFSFNKDFNNSYSFPFNNYINSKKNINKEKYLQSNFYHKKFVINKCIAINKVNLYLFAGIIVNFIIAKSAYSIFFQRKYIKKLNLSVIISRRRLQGSRLKIIK